MLLISSVNRNRNKLKAMSPLSDAYDDESTKQLVLDIVQKVFEPATTITTTVSKAPQVNPPMESSQNCYINANINYFNITSININYNKWSNNDSSVGYPSRYSAIPHHHRHSAAISFVQDDCIHRPATATNYNTIQTNQPPSFWDLYCDGPPSDFHQNANILYQSGHQNINNNFKKNFQRNFVRQENHSYDEVVAMNRHQMYRNEFNNYSNNNVTNYCQFKKTIDKKYCSFCRKNGESFQVYSSHSLYEDGMASCPILKQCMCNICGQKGHTMSHCNLNASKTSILKMIHRCNTMK